MIPQAEKAVEHVVTANEIAGAMEGTVLDLCKVASLLEERLVTVLRPPSPTVGGDARKAREQSVLLTDRLDGTNIMMREEVNHLAGILDRLLV